VTLDVSSVLPFGRLERDEVYFEHDGPRFFALRSSSLGVRLLAICIDDEPEDEVVYLYLALSQRRFELVRGGHVGLREAFQSAEAGAIWRVVEDYSGPEPVARAESVLFEDLSDGDLPTEAARMDLPTPTSPALDEEELHTWASEGLRTVAAIELAASGEQLTEFPLRGLGRIGNALQEAIDALAQEESGDPTDRGPIPKVITEDVQMSALALRAASFVLVIGTDKRGGFLDNSPKVEATLGRLADLIESTADGDVIVEAMRTYGSRARGKFTSLLRSVGAYGSGLGLITAPQSAPPRSARVTSRQLLRALRSIELVEPQLESFTVRRGVLTASHTRRTTFELVDMASGQRYAGKVSPAARAQIDGLAVGRASFVTAEIMEEIAFAAEEQVTGRKYTLLSISPVASQ
jgi:hypothetical protein